jgi:hypothetical protein
MKIIPKPVFKVNEVFSSCISTVNNLLEKSDLQSCIGDLTNAETFFDERFKSYEIYQIQPSDNINEKVGKGEMKIVYNYRMATTGMPGNVYYNKLKSSAAYGKCPLCSVRDVDTLDHYLPKSKFPIYAVTPVNLIPACFKCNKEKKIDFPTSPEEQTLHPYYDTIDNDHWLRAKLLHSNPISFEYCVQPSEDWSLVLKNRTINHFKAFSLNELFSSHASQELRGTKKQLEKLYNKSKELLIDHLYDSYESRLVFGINSWQAVFYHTLLKDEWFTNGGVLL